MKTIRKGTIISIICMAFIFVVVAAFMVTSALYGESKVGSGGLVFDKGIEIEISNTDVDNLSKDMNFNLQYYPEGDTSNERVDFDIAPTGGAEYYIANPSISVTENSEPFYLRLQLECELEGSGASTFSMSASDKQTLFKLFFTDTHNSPVLFNDYFAADANGEYYYYVRDGYGVATSDNLAQVGASESITLFKGEIVNGVTPITKINFKDFGIEVPDGITGVSLSLRIQISNSTENWELPDVALLEGEDLTIENGNITAINTTETIYALPGYVNGEAITSIVSGTTSIDSDAVKVFFPTTMTTIGGYAGTTTLTEVYLGNNVTTIDANAFSGSGLSGNLILPKTLTTIGDSAFEGCENLNGSLDFFNNLTSIGGSAFAGCTGFDGTLTIASGINSIGTSAFENCTNLTTININSPTIAALETSDSHLLDNAREVYVLEKTALDEDIIVGAYIAESVVEVDSDKDGYSKFRRFSYFNSDWKNILSSSTGINIESIKSIVFTTELPDDFNAIGFDYVGAQSRTSTIVNNSIMAYYEEEIIDGTTYYNLAFVSEDDIYAPINCNKLFVDLTNLTEIYFNNFNTIGVTKMSQMFGANNYWEDDGSSLPPLFEIYACSNLTTIGNISNWDVTLVDTMSYMFGYCSSLTNLDLSGWEIDSVINATSFFSGCTSLSEIKAPASIVDKKVLTLPSFTGRTWVIESTGKTVTGISSANGTCGQTLKFGYSVALDHQEGTSQTTNVVALYQGAMPNITVPTRTGYTFEGYYTGENGTGTKYYNADGTSTKAWEETNVTTLYANWTANTYTLTLNPYSGGLLSYMADGTYTGNEATIEYTSNPDKYVFKNTANNDPYVVIGSTVYLTQGKTYKIHMDIYDENENPFTGSVNLVQIFYAISSFNETESFRISAANKTATITANSTGTYKIRIDNSLTQNIIIKNFWIQEESVTESTTATYDSAMLSITVPKRYGYEFAGYYTGVNGAGTKYYNADGTSTKAWEETNVTTLYANWIANTYTVTLNKQEGTGGDSNVTATYGSAMPSITVPTKTGYTFAGYYTGTNGTGTKYYNADGTSAKVWTETNVTTLYADWEPNTYTATWDPNGGTVSPTTSTVTYNSTYTLPTPTRAECTFLGWNGKNLLDLTKVVGDIAYTTLTNSHTLTFNAAVTVNGTANTINGFKVQKWKDGSYVDQIFAITTVGLRSYTFTKDSTFNQLQFAVNGSKQDSAYLIDASHLTDGQTYVISFSFDALNGTACTATVSNLMIEAGSTATAFEPYYLTSTTKVTIAGNHTLTARWMASPAYFNSNWKNLLATDVNSAATGITTTNINSITFTTSMPSGYNTNNYILIGATARNSTTVNNSVLAYYKQVGTAYDLAIVSAGGTEIYAPINCGSLFGELSGITTIAFDNFNTAGVTDMSAMFIRCYNLTSLDLSGFNTESVTNMNHMFNGCESVTSLDISSFNTSLVEGINAMFAYCRNITNLNLSNFNVAEVTDARLTFYQCNKLINLNLNGWKLTNAAQTDNMLDGCTALTNIKSPASIKSGGTIALPNNGTWFVSGNTTTAVTTIGNGTSPTTLNKTIFINASVSTYIVVFDGNRPDTAKAALGGTMSNQSFTYGVSQNLSANKYILSGCEFVGWNTAPDGSGTSYTDGQSVKNLTSENGGIITLYAQWRIYLSVQLNAASGLKEQHDVKVEISTGEYHSGWGSHGVTNLTTFSTLTQSGADQTVKTFNGHALLQSDYDTSDLVRGLGYHIKITLTNKTASALQQKWFTVNWATAAHVHGDVTYENGRSGYEDIRDSGISVISADHACYGYVTVTYGNSGDDTVIITIFGQFQSHQLIEINAYGGEYNGTEGPVYKSTVSFDKNGGSGGQSSSVTATYGSAMPTISTTAPTRTGYTFTGWYDAPTGGTKYYNANGSSAKNWNIVSANYSTTLYAQWVASTSTVTFNADGGSGGQSSSVTATYGSAMPSISTTAPTKTGYTFAGWYDATSGGTKYYNADGTSARTWNKTASSATLYARWTAATTIVSFNNNGGSGGQTANVTATYGFAMPSISKTAPTKTGYIFTGWYDATSGGTKYYNLDGTSARTWNKTASSITLYAQWVADTASKTITITVGDSTNYSNVRISIDGGAEQTLTEGQTYTYTVYVGASIKITALCTKGAQGGVTIGGGQEPSRLHGFQIAGKTIYNLSTTAEADRSITFTVDESTTAYTMSGYTNTLGGAIEK